jgi:HD-like signal output (HDOD) protein
LNRKIPDSHEAAGLLHDIGKIILLSNFEKEYLKSHRLAIDNDDKSIIDAEKSIFGITHQEIGGYLLNWWELPYPIVEAALYHHNPCDEKIINKELVAIVHLANYYSFVISNHELCKISKLNESVFNILDVSKKRFEEFFEELKYSENLI